MTGPSLTDLVVELISVCEVREWPELAKDLSPPLVEHGAADAGASGQPTVEKYGQVVEHIQAGQAP